MNANAIFAYTECGDTPKIISSFLPCCPIYAVKKKKKTYRQLALAWGVTPILVKEEGKAKEIISKGIEIAKAKNYVKTGDACYPISDEEAGYYKQMCAKQKSGKSNLATIIEELYKKLNSGESIIITKQ